MNKKLMILMAAILSLMLVTSVFGDSMKKGSLYMSGAWTAGFSSSGGDLYENIDGDGTTTIRFSPRFGFFLMDGLGIGALVNYVNSSQGDNKGTTLGFGPQIYYYVGAANIDEAMGRVVPYLTAGFCYSSMTSEYAGSTTEYKSTGSTIHLGGGINYFVANSVGIFVEGFYNMESMKQKEPVEGDSVDGNEFGVMVGVTAFFSLGQ